MNAGEFTTRVSETDENNGPATGSAGDFSPILSALREVHAKCRQNTRGNLATYIPELAKTDPQLFGIALATADGQIYEVGDSGFLFTIQSISKPFVFGLTLEDHGVDYVLNKVGVEPSGEAFNSVVFDERTQRPFNPMVNAGAIATTALIKGSGHDDRLARLLEMFGRFVGRPVEVDREVFLSERATGHRNRAIAYLGLNSGTIDDRIEEHLDLYFEQCSIRVSARDLAVMAATLSNNGINPLTGERAIKEPYVKNVLSVMHSCGMYDYAGEWSYRIGLPAKSGVAGGILAVLPGQFGVGIFSPLLDDRGNSCRGIQVCEELSKRFRLHMFRVRALTEVVIRRSYRGSTVRSKRLRSRQEESILDRKAAAVCVYELQGGLFFGTMEQVCRRLELDVAALSYLILDVRRVMQIDECARTLLTQINNMLAEKGKSVMFAHLPEAIRIALLRENESRWTEESFFPDTDVALEWCENRLILEEPVDNVRAGTVVPLAAMDVVAGFTAKELALLGSVTEKVVYGAGETIVREGHPAASLYLLAAGLVSVRLRIGDGARHKRLSTITPGVAFGELALFDGGARSADVISDERSVCYVLPIAKLDELAARNPQIRTKLMCNIGRELSARLRRADVEIRSQEE
jgi:glutaminase